MAQPPGEITLLLRQWSQGNDAACGELYQLVYRELRHVAESQLARERRNHTLQPTALVHEAFIKCTSGTYVDWQDRNHFFAFSARLMRQVLVDHGRRRLAKRRKADYLITLNTGQPAAEEDLVDVLALNQALDRLAALNETQARIVELRYFGGLTIAEVAQVLGQSESGVKRAWRAARAWLYQALVDDLEGKRA